MLRITVRLHRVSGRVPNPAWRRAITAATEVNRRLALADARRRAGDAVRTGEYLNSITARSLGADGFTMESDVPQAWFLEYGTGLYGPKKRSYWIRPRPERAAKNRAEYERAKAIKASTGTWPEGMRKTPHSYLKWYRNSRPFYAMEVEAPGMPAEPNLWPAIIENADAFAENYEKAIVGAWMSG